MTLGKFATTKEDGPNGAFIIPARNAKVKGQCLLIMINSSFGWEHVSIRMYNGQTSNAMAIFPTHFDISDVKNLFWDKDETVVQIFPDERLYKSRNDYIIHLWSCKLNGPFNEFPMPPANVAELVGYHLGERGKKQAKRINDLVNKMIEPQA